MLTKQDVAQMAMKVASSKLGNKSALANVYDLSYYRNRVKFLDYYQPSKSSDQKLNKPKKLKTDKERVAEIQRRSNYRDLK